jgi:phosphate uptake regulator
MDTRKVQLSGGTTYTVSLPKSWAEEHGINAGSILSIESNDNGSLLVKSVSEHDDRERSISLDVSTAGPDAVQQYIRGLYAVGYNTATLVADTAHDNSCRQTVDETVDSLSGFELLRMDDRRLQMEMLIDADKVDVRRLVLRLRLVALAMQRDAITAVTEADTAIADQVVDQDNEADKLFIMVTRYFRRALSDLQETEKLGLSRDELFEYYYTSRQLERVADHAEKTARLVKDPDLELPTVYADEIERFGERARKIVDDAADLILTDGDLRDATAVLAERDDFTEEVTDFDRGLYRHDTPEQAYAAGRILDSLRRTGEYGANVAWIGIQQQLRDATASPEAVP